MNRLPVLPPWDVDAGPPEGARRGSASKGGAQRGESSNTVGSSTSSPLNDCARGERTGVGGGRYARAVMPEELWAPELLCRN